MSDIVERLTNYRPKNEWGDKVHHTICTEAAGEISGLRIDLAAKETEALGYLRAVGELQGRVAELEKALETAQTAMHDWLHIYAPDECKPEQVEESRKRVWAGGTLGYIADVTAEIRSALDAVKER